ncbi:hypothetical protein ACFCYN_03735 [Gottfriedia sp. NPDC056225]
MNRNPDNRNNQNHRNDDSFDRAFFGSPGVMLTLIAIIILGSIIWNYFK